MIRWRPGVGQGAIPRREDWERTRVRDMQGRRVWFPPCVLGRVGAERMNWHRRWPGKLKDVFRESTERKSGRQDNRDPGVRVGQFWEHRRGQSGSCSSVSSLPSSLPPFFSAFLCSSSAQLSVPACVPSAAPLGGTPPVLFAVEHPVQCSAHRRCSTSVSLMTNGMELCN